jgi:hypothetical protein
MAIAGSQQVNQILHVRHDIPWKIWTRKNKSGVQKNKTKNLSWAQSRHKTIVNYAFKWLQHVDYVPGMSMSICFWAQILSCHNWTIMLHITFRRTGPLTSPINLEAIGKENECTAENKSIRNEPNYIGSEDGLGTSRWVKTWHRGK